jgi:cob(I)alamin adenosyltransferase
MANRITGKYLEGKGDTGYSDLSGFEGRVSKGSSLTAAYLSLDELQHSLSTFLNYHSGLVPEIDIKFLELLLQFSFSVNAFIYSGGEDDIEAAKRGKDPAWCVKQLPKPRSYKYMAERIDFFKSEELRILGQETLATEFIIPRGYINKLRLKTRQLEREIWAFRDQRRAYFSSKILDQLIRIDALDLEFASVIEIVSVYETVRSRIGVLGSFLNRLSSYFYWLMRYSHVLNGGQFQEWISEAPEWNEKLESDTI